MGFMAIFMFDKRPEAFGVISLVSGFSAYAQKADFGKRTAIGVMINHIGLLHISFCKRRAGFVSFAEFSCLQLLPIMLGPKVNFWKLCGNLWQEFSQASFPSLYHQSIQEDHLFFVHFLSLDKNLSVLLMLLRPALLAEP